MSVFFNSRGYNIPVLHKCDEVQDGKGAWPWRTGPSKAHVFVYRVRRSQSGWEIATVSASLVYLVVA